MRDIPLFFRLWFAFCFLMCIGIGVATIAVILNPQWIGEFAGRIVHGFNSVQ